MNAAVEAALKDWQALNKSNKYWAEFESVLFENILVVRVQYGVIHSNGQKECALKTKYYHINAAGEVEIS